MTELEKVQRLAEALENTVKGYAPEAEIKSACGHDPDSGESYFVFVARVQLAAFLRREIPYMGEDAEHNIPLDAFTKGRDYGAVLAEYMRVWGEIQEAVVEPGKSPDDIFADTMAIAAYRLYLLGIQDGMKEDSTK